MGEPAVVLRAAGLLTLFVISGSVVARAGSRRIDLFAGVWWGLAVASVAGVMLARAGQFSLGRLALVVAATALAVAPVAWWRARKLAEDDVSPETRRVRGFAVGAAVLACAWFWPPFETFMAASDSTMYVDAGIHLARTGSYDVPDTVGPLLPPDLARALFPSVGIFEQGPYIRLAGGLLKSARDAASATPAFFPLLSMWAGVLAALGGPEAAPLVAPFAMALATWALGLFAGEAFGLAVAVPTVLVFLGNFAVWWFGRFPMSEPFTIAFVWGGLVFLGRGAPFTAGLMLGTGGVARAETLLFAVAAVAWWWATTPVRARDLFAITAGAALVGVLAAAGLFAAPNHHVAYLLNDLAFAWTRIVFRVLPALWDGRILTTVALLPLVPMTAALVAAWRGTTITRGTLRALLVLAIGIAALVYLRVGGRAEPLRHVGWLATSMSPLGLVLGVIGSVIVWRGGPAARLALVLLVVVAAIFVPNPRVGSYQPWAMRRFLPIVLPGLALGAGVALGNAFGSQRRGLRAFAVMLTLAVVALQARAPLAARDAPYFRDSFASVRRLAEQIPPDGVVVLDGGLAELQIQVPLWLVFGRETALATVGGPAWRLLLSTIVASGRPTYWIQNRWGPPPQAKGLTFTAVGAESDMTIHLPNSPRDTPPAVVIRKIVPLRVYGVALEAGAAGSG